MCIFIECCQKAIKAIIHRGHRNSLFSGVRRMYTSTGKTPHKKNVDGILCTTAPGLLLLYRGLSAYVHIHNACGGGIMSELESVDELHSDLYTVQKLNYNGRVKNS